MNGLNEARMTNILKFKSLFVLPYIHLYQSSLQAWNKTENTFKTD